MDQLPRIHGSLKQPLDKVIKYARNQFLWEAMCPVWGFDFAQISLPWWPFGGLKLMHQQLWGNCAKFPPFISLQSSLIYGNKDIGKFDLVDSTPTGFAVRLSGVPGWPPNALKQNLYSFILPCWQDHPVVLTKFIEDAREVEMDAVAKAGRVRPSLFFTIKLVPQDLRLGETCDLNDLLCIMEAGN